MSLLSVMNFGMSASVSPDVFRPPSCNNKNISKSFQKYLWKERIQDIYILLWCNDLVSSWYDTMIHLKPLVHRMLSIYLFDLIFSEIIILATFSLVLSRAEKYNQDAWTQWSSCQRWKDPGTILQTSFTTPTTKPVSFSIS